MKRTTLKTLRDYLSTAAPSWRVVKFTCFDDTTTYFMTTNIMNGTAMRCYAGSPSQLLQTAKDILEEGLNAN